MKPSKHNIITPIKNSDQFFIANLLSGNADIITNQIVDEINHGTYPKPNELLEKGYWVDELEEKKLYQQKYLEFIDNRDTDEVQLFFVSTYACNFACSYCYQDEYAPKAKKCENELTDAFFRYIDKAFASRNKYITLFGGEPLLNTPAQREFLTYFITQANQRNLSIALVTNGYHLHEYVDLLKTAKIKEIQVTLDGTAAIHNQRRMLKGGQGSFEQIAKGIDSSLNAQLPINLRMVIDKENINDLPELSTFAIEKGWTTNPLFKTQLGRNYELHHCQSAQQKLYTRLDIYQDIFELLQSYPHILEFHKPAFSISKFLFEQGELPEPLFDACPGTKTEWAFDYTGKIYSCTATVGKEGEELGIFHPEVQLNSDVVEQWEERDVLSIEKCKTCALQLACGGGCASVAKNINGSICSPDCRPVDQLMSLGIAHYFKEI